MKRDPIRRRFWQVLFGLLLVTIGLSSLAGGQFLTLLLGLAGFYLLTRQFAHSAASAPPRERSDSDSAPEDTPIFSHAARAARRAGLDPASAPLLPIDIGTVALAPDGTPSLHRSTAISDAARSLQPYIQLRAARRAEGVIRFELVDAGGQVVFAHEGDYMLNAGITLISPPAKLPLDESHTLRGEWRLRVIAGGVPIAEHPVGWRHDDSETLRRHLDADGEINHEIRNLLVDTEQEQLSLDDLLRDQPPDSAARQQRAGTRRPRP